MSQPICVPIFISSHIPGFEQESRRVIERVFSSFPHFSPKILTSLDTINQAEVVFADPSSVLPAVAQASGVKWLQSTWAGLDAFYKNFPTAPHFTLTRMGGVFGPGMSEYVLGHILGRERHHSLYRDTQGAIHSHLMHPAAATPANASLWDVARPWYRTMGQLTVGIMGATGSIGQSIARRCYTLGMTVWGLSLHAQCPRDEWQNPADARLAPFSQCLARRFVLDDAADRTLLLHEFLAGCDYVVNVLPNTSLTRGLLGDGRPGVVPLSHCKPGAVLINIGRGGIVTEEALCAALKEGHLAHAVLDVYGTEPLPADSPLLRLTTEEITLTPHVAGITRVEDGCCEIFAANLQRYLQARGSDVRPGFLYEVQWGRGY